jgi:hypothetical protein
MTCLPTTLVAVLKARAKRLHLRVEDFRSRWITGGGTKVNARRLHR